MNGIVTDCPNCRGAAELAATALLLAVFDAGSGDRSASLGFLCDTCNDLVSCAVAPGALPRLALAGVLPMMVKAALQNPESAPDGPAFTRDELLDFHLFLADDEGLCDWFEAMAGR